MTPEEVRADIDNLLKGLSDANLLQSSRQLVLTPLSRNRSRLSWSGEVRFIDTGSLREVVDIIESGAWNAQLVDGSVLQMSWEFQRDVVVKHRYAFIPFPFDTDETDDAWIQREGLSNWLGATGAALAQNVRVGGAFRIDFDAGAAREDHPAAHFTLFGPAGGLQEGRLPLSRPWSPGQFVRFLWSSVCPPTTERDGRLCVDQECIEALFARVPVRALPPTIQSKEAEMAWLAWGRSG